MNKSIAAGLVLAASFATADAARAEQADSAAKSTLSMGDKKFVNEAAKGGMEEVELGQLAQEKASSDDVKKFGKRMVDDHTRASSELTQLAQGKGLTLPAQLDAKERKEKERLAKLAGADFDREYMKMMVHDHEKDVSDFQKEADKGKDPALKEWAARTVVTLKDHLQMARDVAGKIGVKVK